MSTRKEFKFASEADGLQLSALVLEPEGKAKGIVQLVHGMCEYKERYLPFMEFLASNGYICGIHDHRGHGKSVRSREDLGFFYEGGCKAAVEDTHQLTVYLKKTYGTDIPFILLGHSMGSFIVRCYVKKYDSEISKLLVVGSPSNMAITPLGLFLVKCMRKIKGPRAHSKFIDGLCTGTYEKRYKSENTPHSWVSSDKELVRRYNADPYCNYTFTLNGYEQLVSLQKETYDKKGWAVSNRFLPIHFFSGAGDPCAISEKDFQKAVQFMRDRGYENVQAKMYEGMRHEVLNEVRKDLVYSDMLAFIKG